jgi:molybdopterin molybdotransferase
VIKSTGLLPVSDARQRMLQNIDVTPVEQVCLTRSAGRVLAADIIASRTQPPFHTSAMDGYAVRARDVTPAPVTLDVVGVSVAGKRFDGAVNPGQAVRIFTGAPLPDGADTIIIQENVGTIVDDGPVVVTESAESGRFIRPAGLDFHEGDVLLANRTALTPPQTALAAAAGLSELQVRRRPSVALLSTGDELVEPGRPCGPDQIVSSNVYGVAAMLEQAGASATHLGVAPDDPEDIAARLQSALDQGVDIIVTTGGASVGDHDHMQAVLANLGADMAFWKIAMRPGKPMMYGRIGSTQILGLPGNPVSSIVCARLFAVPLIRAMLSLDAAERPHHAILTDDMPANGNREDYVRSVFSQSDDGRSRVTPFGKQDSSMLATLARANALIIRPIDAVAIKAGDAVPTLPIDPQLANWTATSH